MHPRPTRTAPAVTAASTRAYSGGGSYLSDESRYRSDWVRIGLGALDVPGGHLHTPAAVQAD